MSTALGGLAEGGAPRLPGPTFEASRSVETEQGRGISASTYEIFNSLLDAGAPVKLLRDRGLEFERGGEPLQVVSLRRRIDLD